MAVAVVLLLALNTGCSGLLDTGGVDAVVQLEAESEPAVMRVRQQVLSGAPAWGGVRVGERTGDVGATALDFELPGENLDIALGALGQLDARVVSTEIDVEPDQIERTTTTAADGEGAGPGSGSEEPTVRLRVEVEEAAPTGVQGLLQLVVVAFAVVGVVSTFRWLRSIPTRRAARRSRRRRIDRVDLRGDPPTQETPRVPPGW